ncbi:FAD synthase [Drosophila tropicalis]|uniref:FAD synthase n=1 Tax=Drosophila tropicalis TaxID=46794 RepID=UPI0035AB6D7E
MKSVLKIYPWKLLHQQLRYQCRQQENMGQMGIKLKKAQETIERAMALYQPNEMMLCFNGGKDCTVLLDILANQTKLSGHLQAVYIKSHDPFEEIEQFIRSSVKHYQFKLLRYEGLLKLAIEQVVSDHPQVRAIFLGCRSSDPSCSKFSEFMPCDNNWPSNLIRVFPLLDWNYSDIWNYIRLNKVPYCCLYDQGYTSLGGERGSTRVNPNLLVYDEVKDEMVFKAAYELKDSRLERANRDDLEPRARIQNKTD